MLHDIVFLIIGIVLIIGGGNYVTDGAVAVAGKYRMPPMLIGLTVVAFGSATPDFVVSLTSTLHGKSSLAVGNIVGAIIFDLFLVIGIMAMIKPVKITRLNLHWDLPTLAVGGVLLFFCAETSLVFHGVPDKISRLDGVLMLLIFAVYLIYLLKKTPRQTNPVENALHPKVHKVVNKKAMPMWLAAICIVGGLAALVVGGNWIVSSASALALKAGMSEALIGMTIVGIGSSLPDLTTSLIAAAKGQQGLALGNIVGSCIIDILFVLGICSLVHPLAVAGISVVDFGTLALGAILIVAMGAFNGKQTINRVEGVILILGYIAYMSYLINSQG